MRLISAALLSAVALAGCGRVEPDPRGVDHDETLLSVNATGEAEAVPDLAIIQVGIETHAATARAASDANAKKADAIAEALASAGVEEKDLRTSNLSVNRVDWGKFKGQFQANNTLTVRMRDSSKAGDAIAAATDAGANILSGPNLQISDPEKANRGAYIAAYNAARTRAEAYAEAADMEIARVLTIRDGASYRGDYPPPPPPIVMEQAAVDVAAPIIRPGTTRTRVTVQVDFALEPK